MTAEGGETFDVGRDLGLPVTTYPFVPDHLDGTVRHLTIEYPKTSGVEAK